MVLGEGGKQDQCSGERTAYRIVLFSVPVGLSDFSLLEVNEG